MDYQAFVEQLAQEKNYSENLKKAILLAIPLLMKQYPEEKEDVLRRKAKNYRRNDSFL